MRWYKNVYLPLKWFKQYDEKWPKIKSNTTFNLRQTLNKLKLKAGSFNKTKFHKKYKNNLTRKNTKKYTLFNSHVYHGKV